MAEKTLSSIAEQAAAWFQTAEMANGDLFDRLRDGRPDWLYEAVREAHADMLPDDYIYGFVRRSVDTLATGEDEARESVCEPDVYISELTAWLGSHSIRLSYCDEATEIFGVEEGDGATFRLLAQGQMLERERVFDIVLSAIREQVASA